MPGKETQGEGRLPEQQEQDQQGRRAKDISQIDCQEGTMQRGETGGNFQSLEEVRDAKEKTHNGGS